MVVLILCILCGFSIIITYGQKRFNLFVCSILLLSSAIIISNKPYIHSHDFFCFCFLTSIIYHGDYKGQRVPLILPFSIYIIGMLYLGFYSPGVPILNRIWRPISTLLTTYLLIYFFYLGTKNVSINSKWIRNTLLFVTIYGVFCFIIKANPYQNTINNLAGITNLDYFHYYNFGERIRINSTWYHPISYGFICSLFFYSFIQYSHNNKIKLLLVFLFINILLCGGRTSLAAFLFMGCLYLILTKKSIKIVLGLAVISFLCYMFIPIIHNKSDQLIGTIMGTDQTSGSSIDMRNEQLAASFLLLKQSPFTGNGLGYIGDHLTNDTKLLEAYAKSGYNFLGFESYSFIILIERGVLGIMIEFILAFSLIFYVWKHRKLSRDESALFLSSFLGFIFFALGTGTLDTFIPTMLFLGLYFRNLNIHLSPMIVDKE